MWTAFYLFANAFSRWTRTHRDTYIYTRDSFALAISVYLHSAFNWIYKYYMDMFIGTPIFVDMNNLSDNWICSFAIWISHWAIGLNLGFYQNESHTNMNGQPVHFCTKNASTLIHWLSQTRHWFLSCKIYMKSKCLFDDLIFHRFILGILFSYLVHIYKVFNCAYAFNNHLKLLRIYGFLDDKSSNCT